MSSPTQGMAFSTSKWAVGLAVARNAVCGAGIGSRAWSFRLRALPNRPPDMKASLVVLDYQGWSLPSTEDGWFNATLIAEHFGKRVDHWLKTQDTNAYIEAVMRHSNTPKRGDLIRARRGNSGGTWLHPRLAVAFARWCDPDFAVWCDIQIEGLLKGQHPHFDWKRQRHEAASTHKVVAQILQQVRAEQGKATEPHHYMNEARLVNWALAGEFKGLDRDALPAHELTLLAKLELKNATLIGRGVGYPDRKKILESAALELRVVPFPALTQQAA